MEKNIKQKDTKETKIKPCRMQLSRKKGFVLRWESKLLNGLDAVSVARPHRFGNPYVVYEHFTLDDAIELFRAEVENNFLFREEIKRSLRGKNLACWCPLDKPCHADVLLEIANSEDR